MAPWVLEGAWQQIERLEGRLEERAEEVGRLKGEVDALRQRALAAEERESRERRAREAAEREILRSRAPWWRLLWRRLCGG
jgi:chromosome segregation ATPase